MILAHQLASGPDAFGQNLPRPSRSIFYNNYGPGLLWKNGTESDVGSQIQPNSGCMLAVMVITGHNQNASK